MFKARGHQEDSLHPVVASLSTYQEVGLPPDLTVCQSYCHCDLPPPTHAVLVTACLYAAGLPEPERAVLTATLRHSFEAVGGSVIQITFEDTEIKATGGLGG